MIRHSELSQQSELEVTNGEQLNSNVDYMVMTQTRLDLEDEYTEISSGLSDDEFRDKVIKSLFKNWLYVYSEKKFFASSMPNIKLTSTISDMPASRSNEFRSVTEAAAIKCADAQRFLKVFHEKLEGLPADYQRIIEKKYLTFGTDGKVFSDELVYPEIHLGRTKYFELKPKALYWLGMALINEKP